jgi:hypothetical protein
VTATRGIPYTFSWLVSDVQADMESGMTVSWNFNGETTTNVTGYSGTVAYTFTSTGTKTIKVKATDKDGGVSDEVTFTVTVNLPTPKPSVRVAASAQEYNETTTTARIAGHLSLRIVCGRRMGELTSSLLGESQSIIVFATTNALRITAGNTNSATLKFSILTVTEQRDLRYRHRSVRENAPRTPISRTCSKRRCSLRMWRRSSPNCAGILRSTRFRSIRTSPWGVRSPSIIR